MKHFIYISADDRGELQEKKLKAHDLNQAKLYLKRQSIQYISTKNFD